mmetsp:Transcript_19021/g.44379  ORF Transcript_19021/g.44379 Transcript_19021/m.44379 type:complete len:234 (+) Transcript_19021:876-1577(+)
MKKMYKMKMTTQPQCTSSSGSVTSLQSRPPDTVWKSVSIALGTLPKIANSCPRTNGSCSQSSRRKYDSTANMKQMVKTYITKPKSKKTQSKESMECMMEYTIRRRARKNRITRMMRRTLAILKMRRTRMKLKFGVMPSSACSPRQLRTRQASNMFHRQSFPLTNLQPYAIILTSSSRVNHAQNEASMYFQMMGISWFWRSASSCTCHCTPIYTEFAMIINEQQHVKFQLCTTF